MKQRETGKILVAAGCVLLLAGIVTAFFTEIRSYPALIVISVILNTIGIDKLRSKGKGKQ